MSTPRPLKSPCRFKDLCLYFSSLIIICLLLRHHQLLSTVPATTTTTTVITTPTTLRHLLFGIASSSKTFSNRTDFIRLWYTPKSTRAYVFVDSPDPDPEPTDPTLPPVLLYGDTSQFPYTFFWGSKFRYAIRVARIVKQVVELGESDVRWFIFGDDDTLFFKENLVKTLSKYDHDDWYYVGSNSENYGMNVRMSFEMAFGGGGFAISYSLASVLAKVMDSCLMRYPHLFSSDSRVFSCSAELGVGLTREAGFHQVDLLGDLFGLLSAHPLSPLLSLHHFDLVEPLFPNKTKTGALQHLFKAVNLDPVRIFQQTVCYDRLNSLTVSVAWGYAIQVFEDNRLLPDLLTLEATFKTWKVDDRFNYMFNIRKHPEDPCQRPIVFFLDSVSTGTNGVWTEYMRHDIFRNCSKKNATQNLERITVLSRTLDVDIGQVKPLRRQCCDIQQFFNKSMIINIRKCEIDELIAMNP